MWSLGCTLFELFQQISPNPQPPIISKTVNARILFPGQFCFPLSAKPALDQALDEISQDNSLQAEKEDQLNMILKQINPLTESDTCFVERKEMIQYLKAMVSIHENEQVQDSNFLDRLGPLDEDWFMLLHNLLQFNPYLRWSASECLNLDIFNEIRNKEMEEKP